MINTQLTPLSTYSAHNFNTLPSIPEYIYICFRFFYVSFVILSITCKCSRYIYYTEETVVVQRFITHFRTSTHCCLLNIHLFINVKFAVCTWESLDSSLDVIQVQYSLNPRVIVFADGAGRKLAVVVGTPAVRGAPFCL
jgi:hypothetical protein